METITSLATEEIILKYKMSEKKEKKKKRNRRHALVERLYQPIFPKKKGGDPGKLPEGEKDIAINQKFLDDFLKNTKEGRQWCDEAAMHWAEILTFPFSKMIITFDLGVLAFIGVMRESFIDQKLLILSIIYALASLLILTVFMRSVIVKNINSLAERKRILNYTIVLAPHEIQKKDDAENTVGLWKRQGEFLRKNLEGLEEHVKIRMPWQKIGVYFFYASVISVFVGIIL